MQHPIRLRALVILCTLTCAPIGAHGQTPATDAVGSELVGVWYGQFRAEKSGNLTEVWLEITSQKPVNGFDVHGFNRWHTLDAPDSVSLGARSLGFRAEHFDTFSGQLAVDGRSMSWVEDHTKAQVEAHWDGTDTISATVVLDGAAPPGISITLHRVDTGYSGTGSVHMGVDVSHHSGAVDWAGIRDLGYSFAYVKSSEGVDDSDPLFDEHWKTLEALDFPHGAYHFYVTEDDPEEQARFFASKLKEHPGTLPPVVDVEHLGHNTTGDMTTTLLRFLEVFEQETGLRPMIYTTPNFWDRSFRPEFSDYDLWMAEFEVDQPKVPFGWQSWTLWQRQNDQSIPGVEKSADISILHPSLQLQDLIVPESHH